MAKTLSERLRADGQSGDCVLSTSRTMLEAARELDRLTAERADLRKFLMDATGEHPYPPDHGEHDGQTEDEAVESAKLTIMFDRKMWNEACDHIRSGKDWPQTHYPSMMDRWWCAAMRQQISRLTQELSAERERAERKPIARKWFCPYCETVYAEYVNGCPRCHLGEVGTSTSVVCVDIVPAQPPSTHTKPLNPTPDAGEKGPSTDTAR